MTKNDRNKLLIGISIILLLCLCFYAGCNHKPLTDDSKLISNDSITQIIDSNLSDTSKIEINPICLELLNQKQYVIDSLSTIDRLSETSQESLIKEISSMKKTMDSINQSNANLRKYIKHQDAMIKK